MHADSQKLSGVYAMSDEDTMDWDEEPIDWESLFAEVTETNEANSDSVATLELSDSYTQCTIRLCKPAKTDFEA